MTSSMAYADTSVRELFDELIDLPPARRIERFSALELDRETHARLRAMLVFDE